jgi:hypothetical protein
MIDMLAVLIGLFLLVAIVRNKDISKKKANADMLTLFAILILFLVLGGLGFLLSGRARMAPNFAYPIGFAMMFSAVAAGTKGQINLLSKIAAISTLAYIVAAPLM